MKYFKNWSSEDFTCLWDSNPSTVKKGEIKPMEDYLADHFALHLTNRELQKKKLPLVGDKRNEYFEKCFATVEVTEAVIEEKIREGSDKISGELIPEKPKKIKKVKKAKPFEDLKNETTNKKGSNKKAKK